VRQEQLAIPEPALNDLAAIRDVPAANLEQAARDLSSLGNVAAQRDVRKIVARATSGTTADPSSLLQLIIGLQGLVDPERFDDHATLVAQLTQSLDATSRWNEVERARWRSIAPTVVRLLQAPCLRTLARANDLAFEHAAIFRTARCITDLRPVFGPDRLEEDGVAIPGDPIALVATNVLKVRYLRDRREHELRIAVSEDDLQRLADVCNRGLAKTTALRGLSGRIDAPILSIDEDDANERP